MTKGKRIGLRIAVAMMLSASTTFTAMAGYWQQAGANWYYYADNGSRLTGWQQINATWYYFNADGRMLTGWNQIDGNWYYMRADGSMVTDQWIGNYYVGSSGVMAVNTWIGPYYVGSDGAWIQNTGGGNDSSNVTNEEQESMWITDMTPVEKKYGYRMMGASSDKVNDSFGNKYLNDYAIVLYGKQYAVYYANEKYNTIKGTIAPHSTMNSELDIEIYADDELVYSSGTIDRLTEPFEFEADISGAKFVKIKGIGETQSVVAGTRCILYKTRMIAE